MILLQNGFRPFFLGAGLYAAVAVGAWGSHLTFATPMPAAALAGSVWHGHEMLFGYTAAALAGFLLTATPNWSGRAALSGAPLAALAALWVAGRAAMWLPADAVPAVLTAVLDVAFMPALLVAILPALTGNPRRQGIFIVLLLALTAGNGLYHAEALGFFPGGARMGLIVGLDVYVLLLTVLGGRVVPAFTANALKRLGLNVEPRSYPLLERLTFAATVLFAILDVAGPQQAAAVAALAAGLLHAVRLSGWHGQRGGEPIVWVLHVAYLWVPVGLVLNGVAGLNMVPSDGGLHALGAGAVGTMTLAIMSRAALGHSGRPLVAPPGTVAAYLLVIAAAALRVLAGLGTVPAAWGYGLSAAAWTLGFGLFFLTYLPVCLGPRADRAAG